jgi:hypothetical protein
MVCGFETRARQPYGERGYAPATVLTDRTAPSRACTRSLP